MKIGIVLDSWKLEIFKRHLDKAGYIYTEFKGPVKDTRLLKVETSSAIKLRSVTEAAQLECSLSKKELS